MPTFVKVEKIRRENFDLVYLPSYSKSYSACEYIPIDCSAIGDFPFYFGTACKLMVQNGLFLWHLIMETYRVMPRRTVRQFTGTEPDRIVS